MATKIVSEPGIYGGVYRQAGARYDDGKGGSDDPQISATGTAPPEGDGAAAERDRALGQQGSGPDGGAPADDLDGKSKADLEEIAKERGVDISAARTKADIIEALRKA